MVESTLFISLRRRVNKQRCKQKNKYFIMIVFKAHIFGIYLHAVDTTYLKNHMTDGILL